MNEKWTPEELEIIEAKAEVYTVKQIASILKRRGYKRSVHAIEMKLNSMGYCLRPTLDNYSCHEVARVLNLSIYSLCRWINRGWIKAKKRNPRLYQIRRWDLKRFLDNPPQHLKKRIASIDPQAINYLVGK